MKTANLQSTGLRRREVALSGLSACLLAGCAGAKLADGGVVEYSDAPLPNADVIPTNPDPSRRTRVVVLASDESPSSPGIGLANVASATLETILGTGGVEVVERSLADRLDKELKLAEISGKGSYGGPDVADYAIRVILGTSGAGNTYKSPSTSKNPFTGKVDNNPGGYVPNGNSVMTLRIYALPSLKLIEAIAIEGKSSAAMQPVALLSQQTKADLMRGATAQGIQSKKTEVANLFQPKGYITARRVKDKVSIFRVQLGKNTGAKTGNQVEIWTLQKVGDSFDEVPLGKGVMSNVVGAEGSWMLVSDEKVAARIRKFDYVKVKAGGLGDLIPSLGTLF